MLVKGTEEAVAVLVVELVAELASPLALDEEGRDEVGEVVGSSAVTVEVTRVGEVASAEETTSGDSVTVTTDEEDKVILLGALEADVTGELETATLDADATVESALASLPFGLASSVGAAPGKRVAALDDSIRAGFTWTSPPGVSSIVSRSSSLPSGEAAALRLPSWSEVP